MTAALRFIIFQVVIIVPFVVGMSVHGRYSHGVRFTKKLIRLNLILLEPIIALWSIWGLPLSLDVIGLPISGLLLALLGLALGRAFVPVLALTGKSRASFIISSSLANHGFTMGAFICYLLMGEKGLGLSFIFLTYFMIYVFTVIFPYAQMVSTSQRYSLSFLKEFFLNLQNMPLVAVIVGLTLHGAGIQRPQVFFPIDFFMIVSIAIYYFTLGINFKASDIGSSIRESLVISLIKFLLVPAVTFIVLTVVNLDRNIEAIILIQSFMPAAIYSVVAPVLFDLDTRLASNIFVLNSIIFLVLVLPLLFTFRGCIFAAPL